MSVSRRLCQSDSWVGHQLGQDLFFIPAFCACNDPLRIPANDLFVAHRVVSQYWSIDEFAYSILPAEDVVAVSESAYLEEISNVLANVKRFNPAVATDPERVVALYPDLMLVSISGRADYTSLARSSGVPVYRMQTMFETLDQINCNIGDARSFPLTSEQIDRLPEKIETNNCSFSWHPGGAFFAFGDGSVHFLSESLELRTFWLLGDRMDSALLGELQ